MIRKNINSFAACSRISLTFSLLINKLSTPLLKESITISFILSALTVTVYYSQWLDLFEEIDNDVLDFDVFLTFVLLFVLLSCALFLLFKGFLKVVVIKEKKITGVQERKTNEILPLLNKYLFNWNVKSIFISTMAIFILWLPYMYASYPPNMDWDTLNQIFQYATEAPVDYAARSVDVVIDAKYIDHDTIATTLLFGSFWRLGEILGNQNIGLFIYTILQSIFCAFSFGILCSYLKRIGMSFKFCMISFVFCSLFPVFSDYAATMLKDSIFTPFFLLYFIAYVEAFRTNGYAFQQRSFVFAFVLLILGCIATKKVALYILLISSFVIVIVLRRIWFPIFTSTIGTIVVYSVILQCLIYPALDVQSVGRQEMFSVPFQQTAAVAIRFPDECSEWERTAINKILPYEELKDKFDPLLADPIKNSFKNGATTSDILHYLAVYLVQGFRHPIFYMQVLFKLDGAMIVPSNSSGFRFETATKEAIAAMKQFEGDADVDIFRSKNHELLASYFNHLIWWGQFELGILGTMGLYGGWLPITLIVLSLFLSRKTFWLLTPITLSSLVLLVCPVATARYVLPLMYCAPLLVAILVLIIRGAKVKNSEYNTDFVE